MDKQIVKLVIKALQTQHDKVLHRYEKMSDDEKCSSYDGILMQKLDIAIDCVEDLLEG